MQVRGSALSVMATAPDTLSSILAGVAHLAEPMPVPFNRVAAGLGMVLVAFIGVCIGDLAVIVLLFLALLRFSGSGCPDLPQERGDEGRIAMVDNGPVARRCS